MRKEPSFLYVVIAAFALAVGLLVYLTDRAPEHSYFLFHVQALTQPAVPVFGAVGDQFPALLHIYAFILLTVAVVGASNARLVGVCAAWFVIAVLFESGQHPAAAAAIAAFLPSWLAHFPVLDNTAAYFLNGTFDPLDILASLLGTAAAALTVVLTARHTGSRWPRHGAWRRLALGGAMVAGMLSIVGSGGSGESHFIPGSGDLSKLYVSGNASDALLVYDAANSVSGTTAASRTVTGVATTLDAPRGIAVDMARNLVYVANTAGNSILVFGNARTMSGDIAPSRAIEGASTTLDSPSALFFDMFNDRLYVVNSGADAILVFDNVSTADGDVAPSRTLTGVDTTLNVPYGIFVDVTRDKLYVSNTDGKILVFSNASGVSGNIAPDATLSGGSTTLSNPSGIFVDVLTDRMYVANAGANTVLVFNDSSNVSGNMAPNRTISGPASRLNQPRAVFVDIGTDRLYVANTGGDEILVFNNASVVTGAAAPDRTLALAAGTSPYGISVDVTPTVVGSSADLDGEAGSNNTATSTGGAPRTGDVDNFPTDIAYRQFYSFNLSGIPAGTVVSAATLRLYQASVTGSPYDGTLGSVVVDHVNYGASLTGAAYSTVPLLSNIGVLSSDGNAGYKTLSVAARVQDDLSNARSRSQYRLRFSLNDSNLDGGDDYAQFTDIEDSCCSVNRPPQLTITIQP